VKTALGGEATQNAIGSINSQGMLTASVSNADLETLLLQIQSQRADLLEKQLSTQIEGVQKRNNEIAVLNELLSRLRYTRPQKSGDTVAVDAEYRKAIENAGMQVPASGTLSQADIDQMIATLRGKIDALNNSQQMDMLRLQGLSNKRQEAFDTMTNFIKKMAEQRSSIIGNMR